MCAFKIKFIYSGKANTLCFSLQYHDIFLSDILSTKLNKNYFQSSIQLALESEC